MTMRQLTEDELDKTNKGIARLDKEIVDLEESIEFNKKTIAFQERQVEYQDFARPYLKKKKEKEDEKIMDFMNQDLLSKAEIVNNLKDQIVKGVEIKNKGE